MARATAAITGARHRPALKPTLHLTLGEMTRRLRAVLQHP